MGETAGSQGSPVFAEMVSGEQAGTGQHPATSAGTTAGTTDSGTELLLPFALRA